MHDFAHKISENHTIQEGNHEMKFNMSDFDKIEQVKISFTCENEGSDNPWGNARSLSTALTPKVQGNQGRCNAEAATHTRPGAAYATLTGECLDGSQSLARQSTPSAEAPATTAVQPDGPTPANALSHEAEARHDEQQRKWDATARRNIDLICTGCTGPGRSPPRQPAEVEPKVKRP